MSIVALRLSLRFVGGEAGKGGAPEFYLSPPHFGLYTRLKTSWHLEKIRMNCYLHRLGTGTRFSGTGYLGLNRVVTIFGDCCVQLMLLINKK